MRRGITIAEPEILNEIRERATWPVRKKMHFNDFDVKIGVTALAFAPPAFSSRLTLPGVELILTDQTGFAFRRTHDPALPKERRGKSNAPRHPGCLRSMGVERFRSFSSYSLILVLSTRVVHSRTIIPLSLIVVGNGMHGRICQRANAFPTKLDAWLYDS
jgi:hypothetical protein